MSAAAFPNVSVISDSQPEPQLLGSGPQDTSDATIEPATAIIVGFKENDPDNPRNWSKSRKWTVVAVITLVDHSVSWVASGFSPAEQKFIKDFNVSKEIGTLGLSLYVLGLALGPMTLAPLSEYYGRTPLYVIPYGVLLLFLLGSALVDSLAGFLVLRILSGLCASVTIANFGGTIADMWDKHEVGPAMSVFLWAAVAGSPTGFFLFSFVAQYRGWRDVFWALLGTCGGFWLAMTIVLLGGGNETRHSVLLRRKAGKMRQEGQHNVQLPDDATPEDLRTLFATTLTRPFRFLSTEAIIIFAASYNGFLYGLSFLSNGAFSLVFGPMGQGFGTIGVGCSFLGLVIGISLGPVTNIWQESRYQRYIRSDDRQDERWLLARSEGAQFRNAPEARLNLSKVAAITLSISLWWFAWTSVPEYHIHWIVPILATTLFGWSFYTLILMTYQYVAGAYMVFSASALAGVGLVRNLAGAGFPLFGNQMFEKLGYNWAGTVLACLSMLLIPIPFVLDKYGTKLRARSPYARQHMDDVEGKLGWTRNPSGDGT